LIGVTSVEGLGGKVRSLLVPIGKSEVRGGKSATDHRKEFTRIETGGQKRTKEKNEPFKTAKHRLIH
jgi:hypothetical protein